MRQTRDELVRELVDEYRKNGEKAAIALFDTMIKLYGISQLGDSVDDT